MPNEKAKIIRFHTLGGPEVLRIDEVPLPEPGPGEVRLRVHAFGLNHSEILFRSGNYLRAAVLPSKLGYEASGIVEAVGKGVDNSMIGRAYSSVPGFDMGKYGVYGEVAILPAESLAAYPENLSFVEGASVWMAYLTAYGPLVHLAAIRSGDYVVITAASSSVGLAALDIVRAEGAISIATTRNPGKKDKLLAMGADHVIVTSQEDVALRIREITGNMGARVIFDAVGGDGVRELAEAATFGGIIFIYGLLTMAATPFPVVLSITKGLTMRGFAMHEITLNPALRAEAERYLYERLENGQFKPKIDRIFKFGQIVEAHRYMESSQQVGKIAVTVNDVDTPLPSLL
ncbi:MAG: zinc-dependent alcohol dehydrogenase family protein [Tatlockia sp.]|jgi:NADPH:quinone reductase-like Zn-dependent oxidoreductase